MAFGENFLNWLAPSYQTSDEREAEDLQGESLDAWGDVLGGAPSAYDLQGLDIFGGDMPDEYLDAYLAEQGLAPRQGTPRGQPNEGGAIGGSRGGNYARPGETVREGRIENATEVARQQYVQEQLRNDPLYGLQVGDVSQLAGAAADPHAIEAQNRALDQMMGIYDAGGYTDAERAQMQLAERDAANFARSQRLGVERDAAARGIRGSGLELMGALDAEQAGANRASDYANQIAIAGQQRALEALAQGGTWAGQIRGQSFDEDATRRSAADDWAQYRTGLIGARQQQAGDAAQQTFNNQVVGTQGLTGQQTTVANANTQEANANAQQAGAIAQTIAGGVQQAVGAATGGPKPAPGGGGAAGTVAGGTSLGGGGLGTLLGGRTGSQQAPDLPTYGRTTRRY